MPYLGNVPAEAYTNTVKDSFNGDASTTAFTLSQPSTANNLRVVVENVIQDPTVAYTVSGTTLTFTSAPPVGTANIYAVHLGPATQTAVPPSEINNATNFTDGITVDKDGGTVITADRASSDGTIIDLQKDGSGVGTIGSNGGAPYFSGTENGIKIVGPVATTVDALGPSTATGNNRDNSMDLGWSGNRFNDLYLGGGMYVGGTGSANYLHDYEYGTFTPTYGGKTTDPSGVTYDGTVGNEGIYVKVGRLVYIQINIRTDAISSVGSGDLLIRGLPFSTAALSGQGGIASLTVSQSKDFLGEVPIQAYIEEGVTYVTLFYKTASDGNSITSACSDLATGSNSNLLRIGGTYYTTA